MGGDMVGRPIEVDDEVRLWVLEGDGVDVVLWMWCRGRLCLRSKVVMEWVL